MGRVSIPGAAIINTPLAFISNQNTGYLELITAKNLRRTEV